jgi:hypothetical protein
VEKLTGTVHLGYDARGLEVRCHREFDATALLVQRSAEKVRSFSPSGLLREVDSQDGLVIAFDCDDPSRPLTSRVSALTMREGARVQLLGQLRGAGVVATLCLSAPAAPRVRRLVGEEKRDGYPPPIPNMKK